MTISDGNRCHSCRYFSAEDKQPYDGQCRYSAPIPIGWDGRVIVTWPETAEEYWCGKFEDEK